MHTFITYLKTVLIWSLLIGIVGILLFAIIYPIIIGDRNMFYMHIFLIIQLVTCLGIARIYNSVFHNTRTIVGLSKTIQKLMTEIPILRKVISDETKSSSKAVEQLRETLKGIRENSTKVDILSEEIKKWNQKNYGNISGDNSGSRKAGK